MRIPDKLQEALQIAQPCRRRCRVEVKHLFRARVTIALRDKPLLAGSARAIVQARRGESSMSPVLTVRQPGAHARSYVRAPHSGTLVAAKGRALAPI